MICKNLTFLSKINYRIKELTLLKFSQRVRYLKYFLYILTSKYHIDTSTYIEETRKLDDNIVLKITVKPNKCIKIVCISHLHNSRRIVFEIELIDNYYIFGEGDFYWFQLKYIFTGNTINSIKGE